MKIVAIRTKVGFEENHPLKTSSISSGKVGSYIPTGNRISFLGLQV
jgi:hypothetical protein